MIWSVEPAERALMLEPTQLSLECQQCVVAHNGVTSSEPDISKPLMKGEGVYCTTVAVFLERKPKRHIR
jgi:hypothetical protein